MCADATRSSPPSTPKWAGFLDPREPVCPPALLERARAYRPARIAVANAGHPLPLQSARLAVDAGIMEPVFTGVKAAIDDAAAEIDWDISAYAIVEAAGEAAAARTAFEAARDGIVDAVMKGHLHSDVLMKAAIDRRSGILDGNRLVHIFHINPPGSDRALLISDAAVNVQPNLATRKQSIRSMITLARALGIEHPRIALLSASEEPVATIPSAEEAGQLADWAASQDFPATVMGPLALDLVLSAEAARLKGMDTHPVAGQADGVLVPDLVSGNVLFKALVYLAGGCAAGIVMGGRVPVLLTSRADPPAARLASAAIAAILCGQAAAAD